MSENKTRTYINALSKTIACKWRFTRPREEWLNGVMLYKGKSVGSLNNG